MKLSFPPAFAAGALLLALASLGSAAKAQGYRDHDGDGDRAREVYCASNDDRGTRCPMPWRDSVLAQQMSRAACVEGETWGSDPYSVWVKDGCRGNFGNARDYRYGDGWHDRGRYDHDDRDDRDDRGDDREVYCASNDNRGARCQMPWRRSALSRQMSNAACIEGQTWGSDPYSVWVKDGCRGQFREARGGYRHW